MGLFRHVLVPVASEADVTATCDALEPYLSDLERVTAVHVIEKSGGGIDKAPLGKRKEDAAAFLTAVEARLTDEIAVDTETYYGTDVVDTLFEATVAHDADAVAYRARGGSRIARLLAGDLATKLVTDPAVPVVSLPLPDRE